MKNDFLTDMVITSVRSVITMYTEKNTSMRRTDRPCWAVVIKHEGETVYTSCGHRFVSDANNAILLPKGCNYEWHCTAAGNYSLIDFDCPLTAPEPIVFRVTNSDKILKLFRELECRRTIKSPTTNMESIRDTYNILVKIAQNEQRTYQPRDKLRLIEPALEYISQNYNTKLKHDELANLTGISPTYFRRLFTQFMGMPPLEYIHSLRIAKAKEMLASDYSSLSDIAQALGYRSDSDFSRTFRKYVGMPPNRYRLTQSSMKTNNKDREEEYEEQ